MNRLLYALLLGSLLLGFGCDAASSEGADSPLEVTFWRTLPSAADIVELAQFEVPWDPLPLKDAAQIKFSTERRHLNFHVDLATQDTAAVFFVMFFDDRKEDMYFRALSKTSAAAPPNPIFVNQIGISKGENLLIRLETREPDPSLRTVSAARQTTWQIQTIDLSAAARARVQGGFTLRYSSVPERFEFHVFTIPSQSIQF